MPASNLSEKSIDDEISRAELGAEAITRRHPTGLSEIGSRVRKNGHSIEPGKFAETGALSPATSGVL